MGDRFKGLVHPCKVYNILAVGAPFLYIGPEESHVTDLLQTDAVSVTAYLARHYDVKAVAAHIQAEASGPIRSSEPTEQLSPYSSHVLLPRMIAILEQAAERTKPVPGHVSAQETEAR